MEPGNLSQSDVAKGQPYLSVVVPVFNEEESSLNVYTLHAEFEGMSYLDWFRSFIQHLKRSGVTFARLKEEAQAAHRGPVTFCQIYQGNLPGRTGPVALQGAQVRANQE